MNWKTHAFALFVAVCLLGSLTGCSMTPLPPECRSTFPSNGVRSSGYAHTQYARTNNVFSYQVAKAEACNHDS